MGLQPISVRTIVSININQGNQDPQIPIPVNNERAEPYN
jgi:hypothetical protein